MQVNNSSKTAYTLTKKTKIIKAVFSAALPAVYYFLCMFLGVSSVILVLPMTFFVAIAYAIPLFINVSVIKKGEFSSIKPFVIGDLLFMMLPAVCSAFSLALTLFLFSDDATLVFMFAIILVLIFIVINLYFWFSYYINNTVIKKLFKNISK